MVGYVDTNIPTARGAKGERRKIIKNSYEKFLSKGNHFVNDFLQEPVYINSIGKGETIFRASLHWKSTLAFKYLPYIIKNAKVAAGERVYFPTKKDDDSQKTFVNLAVLYYDFSLKEISFKVKLTLGVQSTGKFIQYSFSKIEIK